MCRLPPRSQLVAEASLVEGPGGSCTLCPTFVTHLLRALPAKSQFGGSVHMKNPPCGRNHREEFELGSTRQRAEEISCCNR